MNISNTFAVASEFQRGNLPPLVSRLNAYPRNRGHKPQKSNQQGHPSSSTTGFTLEPSDQIQYLLTWNTQPSRLGQWQLTGVSLSPNSSIEGVNIQVRVKVVPLTTYPEYRTNPLTVSSRTPFRQKRPTLHQQAIQRDLSPSPTSSAKLITTTSDKLITQFFQRKLKTVRPYTAYQLKELNECLGPQASKEPQQTHRPNQSFEFDQCEIFNIQGQKSQIDQKSNYEQKSHYEQKSQFKRPHHRRPQTSSGTRISSPNLIVTNAKETQKPEESLDQYVIGEVIGKGSYATVRLARDRTTGRQVAIKSYEKSNLTDPQKRNNVKREIAILHRIHHPNIILLLRTINSSQSINLVMEYPGSLSMRNYLKQFQNRTLAEDDARTKFRQIVQAIDHCHTYNVIHRDIKLENILLDSQEMIKVIDFGFAVSIAEGTKLNIFCGTPSYMAPEIVSKQEYLGKPVDIWSLGVLLYVFLNGQFPFRGKEDKELFKAIKTGVYRMRVQVSFLASRLINNMLRLKPSERYTTQHILRDPWFQ